jgi:hypothetical protein
VTPARARARAALVLAAAAVACGCAAGSPPAAARAEAPFTPCEAPRPELCTFEYAPVCADVDTGVRCVKAPCPSSERRTYPNACAACADAKVLGHRPGACEAS